jgi:hypothetical protein
VGWGLNVEEDSGREGDTDWRENMLPGYLEYDVSLNWDILWRESFWLTMRSR